MAYTQSDEISLLLVDYEKLESEAWFDYEVQKVCSISAASATLYFNQVLPTTKGAMFDSRCFNMPKEEVANYFYWRQLDTVRNSIQMHEQANFAHRELQNKSCAIIKEMLAEKRIFWDELNESVKQGSCVCYNSDKHEWEIFISFF